MAARRRHTIFCLDCGTQLIAGQRIPTPDRVANPTPPVSPQRDGARRVGTASAAADERTGRGQEAAAPSADGKRKR